MQFCCCSFFASIPNWKTTEVKWCAVWVKRRFVWSLKLILEDKIFEHLSSDYAVANEFIDWISIAAMLQFHEKTIIAKKHRSCVFLMWSYRQMLAQQNDILNLSWYSLSETEKIPRRCWWRSDICMLMAKEKPAKCCPNVLAKQTRIRTWTHECGYFCLYLWMHSNFPVL